MKQLDELIDPILEIADYEQKILSCFGSFYLAVEKIAALDPTRIKFKVGDLNEKRNFNVVCCGRSIDFQVIPHLNAKNEVRGIVQCVENLEIGDAKKMLIFSCVFLPNGKLETSDYDASTIPQQIDALDNICMYPGSSFIFFDAWTHAFKELRCKTNLDSDTP